MAKKNSNGSSRSKGLNKHQRSAFKEGEERVGREEIQELLQMSQSEDPTDRLQAASFLCPCHVRKRIDEVWEALYRMLEDGGKPDDPALDEKLRAREQASLEAAGIAHRFVSYEGGHDIYLETLSGLARL